MSALFALVWGFIGVLAAYSTDSTQPAPQRGISIYTCLWNDWKEDGVFTPPREIREVRYNFKTGDRIGLVLESTLKYPISLDYTITCGTNSIEKGSVAIPGSASGEKVYSGLGFPVNRFAPAHMPYSATWFMATSTNLIGLTTFTVSPQPGK